MPLVILPGLLCDSRMFGGQIEAFDAQVIDGFYGRASRIEAMAAYALERMPDTCSLLGHSMGARVALEVWRAAPGRVSRIALADTGVHAVRPGEADKRYRLLDLGRDKGVEALVDEWLPPMMGRAHQPGSALYGQLHKMACAAGLETFAVQIEALLHRPEAEPLLTTIDRPAFAIGGREDTWSPVDQHEAIAARIPGCQLRIIENAGHMAPVEQPEKFNEVIREWLAWPLRI
ncbi:MAG: alpha/beta hydrolase [Novosphingobium sp.]